MSTPVPGSWHDVHTWNDSAFLKVFADRESIGDLGYLGTGRLTGRRKPPGQERPVADKNFSQSVSRSATPWNGP
ncbi:hypothetical protein [Streptomyces sp. NPDC088748]|uniref:hypothetical protein n=1 Tax=Streptomyces sp. NPDC088748 TaxID=3365887 RepID=UPI003825D469